MPCRSAKHNGVSHSLPLDSASLRISRHPVHLPNVKVNLPQSTRLKETKPGPVAKDTSRVEHSSSASTRHVLDPAMLDRVRDTRPFVLSGTGSSHAANHPDASPVSVGKRKCVHSQGLAEPDIAPRDNDGLTPADNGSRRSTELQTHCNSVACDRQGNYRQSLSIT